MTQQHDDSAGASRRAAALRYEAGADRAPRVVAKGQGPLAEEIIRRARDSGVAIHESPELAAALMQFEVDQQIPPALYIAVAEVLAWAYGLDSEPASADASRRDPAQQTQIREIPGHGRQ
jgi:flagellar biosynthesis protein